MRAIENLSGRRRLLPIYHRWRAAVVASNPRPMGVLLDMIGTRLAVHAPAWPITVPPQVPLVIIANISHRRRHRGAGAGRAARPSLPHSHQQRLHEAAGDSPLCAADRLRGEPEAIATNLTSRTDARRLLRAGHHRGVPGRRGRHRRAALRQGRGAALEGVHGPADPAGARQRCCRSISKGRTARCSTWISRYSLMLRLSLLVSEFRRCVGATICGACGRRGAV